VLIDKVAAATRARVYGAIRFNATWIQCAPASEREEAVCSSLLIYTLRKQLYGFEQQLSITRQQLLIAQPLTIKSE